MTDASGAIRARYDYDPYGRRTKVSGDLDADFGFTGHYVHAATGLDLALYRAYDPGAGRWLSRDPVGEREGINAYAYADNDPLNEMDLDGLWPTGAYGSENVHGNSINRVLGSLPQSDRDILIKQQLIVDEDQSAEGSYKHAMRDGKNKQSAQAARKAANDCVGHHLRLAQFHEEDGDHYEAMQNLGIAIHVLQDSTSPMHQGFQPWDGKEHSFGALQHGMGENFDPGPGSALDAATKAAWDYYKGNKPMPADFFTLGYDKKPK